MGNLLLTGFEPFDGDDRNPSGEVARALHGLRLDRGLNIHGTVLPVTGPDAVAQTKDLVGRLRPERVVMLGLAADRSAITPERVAINLDDYMRPDNAGMIRRDAAIVESGPDALFCSLNTRAMVEALVASGIPGALSYSAGTFICNHLTYAILHVLADDGAAPKAGFVHLPWPSDWDKRVDHSVTFSEILKGVRSICEVA